MYLDLLDLSGPSQETIQVLFDRDELHVRIQLRRLHPDRRVDGLLARSGYQRQVHHRQLKVEWERRLCATCIDDGFVNINT